MKILTPLLERVPPRVLRTIDQWKFWVTLLVVVVGFGLVWMFVITQRLTREQATRQARIEADYRACILSIPSLRSISRHVSGVNDLARVLVGNSEVLLRHTNASQRAFRLANLQRLRAAEVKIAAVKSFDVPTVQSCAARRKTLGG